MRPLSHAADDERDGVGGVGVEVAEVSFDLHGELAGGEQDEGGRAAGFRFGQHFQNGNDEAEGFASAGLGGGEDVFALKGGRNCAGLHGGGDGEVHGSDALLERLGDIEVGKLSH